VVMRTIKGAWSSNY